MEAALNSYLQRDVGPRQLNWHHVGTVLEFTSQAPAAPAPEPELNDDLVLAVCKELFVFQCRHFVHCRACTPVSRVKWFV